MAHILSAPITFRSVRNPIHSQDLSLTWTRGLTDVKFSYWFQNALWTRKQWIAIDLLGQLQIKLCLLFLSLLLVSTSPILTIALLAYFWSPYKPAAALCRINRHIASRGVVAHARSEIWTKRRLTLVQLLLYGVPAAHHQHEAPCNEGTPASLPGPSGSCFQR